jgi:hypothetical protein
MKSQKRKWQLNQQNLKKPEGSLILAPYMQKIAAWCEKNWI